MGDYDADLVDHLHWARNLRGLSDNTLRVRTDVLYRLSSHVPVALRAASEEHLLAFERVAIAGRAAETRRTYSCHIRGFYRWLLAGGLVDHDPSLVLTLPVMAKHLPRPIDEQDLAEAIAAARPKLRAMLTLGAFAGLRCAEIAGLEWSDLRREPDGRAYLHVHHGKGGKGRVVDVGTVVVQALQAYGAKRRGPMFIGREGAQITPNAVSRAINNHLRRLDIDATAHQLRHRYGSIAYQLSRDLRMVQEQLGHSSPQTTAGYARPSAEAAARMVAAMDALVVPTARRPAGSAPAGRVGCLNHHTPEDPEP